MKLLGEYHHIDVACIPIGDVYTMGVVDGARAVGFMKPVVAFPIHFDTWDKLRVDPLEWARLVMQDTKTVPKVLTP
jgi:L-ascorbate metabolism protein UlaG (beta-lactamase superfamily)